MTDQMTIRCRLHGAGCSVPWGYDQEHTDSSRPYTLDELNERPIPPHRYAYPTIEDYRAGFHLYRALRLDALLNTDERRAKMRAIGERLNMHPDDLAAILG